MHFALPHRADVLLLTASAFLLFATGHAVSAQTQSQTPEKPAATPAVSASTTTQKAASTPTPVTGTIKGRLVASDGQPLTNANVIAQSLSATRPAKPARPDSEGRFVFDDLPAASYIIIAMAPGYIDQSRSLGDLSHWPRYLIGSNVRVMLIKGGVITGLITNAKGEPVVGVPVHATRQDVQTSISFFTDGGVSETDDRGSYRIYGLLPGQYTVNAGSKGQFGRFTPSGFDIDVPVYYPSSTRDTAVPISVRSGDETSGIDIRYESRAGHSLSGVVLGNVAVDDPRGGITIFLAHAGSTSVVSLEMALTSDPRRAFSFQGIADGEYDLFANSMAKLNEGALAGTKRVTVRGGDVTGVELNLTPLASISGAITLDSIKPEDRCDKRGSQVIEIIPAAPRDEPKKSGSPVLGAILGGGMGMMNEKGEFAFRNLEAATYRLEIKLPTASWYVRAINLPSAAARGQQLPMAPATQPLVGKPNPNPWQGVVTVRSGEKLNGVSILVGQDAAGLRGRVGPDGTVIREGTRIHLVPVEREQAHNVLRYGETFVRSDGSFALANIAPGRYFILPNVDPQNALDTSRRPVAWNFFSRARLRLKAEAANTIVELKPCQNIIDYSMKLGTAQ